MPGQLVQVRRHHFAVQDVQRSALPDDQTRPDVGDAEHVVTLASVEDDSPDQELQVIWELEPGARVIERATLPEVAGFDDPRRLDAFLDAIRWGATSSAEQRQLHSPFRSGITIEDYQLEPLVRALQMPRVSLLIADDVGAGKTIEAGLVVQELILRHRVRSALVVCPASLQVQWRDQMRDKFGLDFRIVDAECLRDLRRRRGLRVNVWSHYPRLITSIDFLKRDRPLRLFRELLPAAGEPAYPRKFDLLIVDEAHNVAPAAAGNYATDSLRTAAIRTIAPHFEHKLFLTATPHNGYSESFSALLELLDNQRFARFSRTDPNRQQLGTVMVRRMKTELPPKWDGTPRFPKRKILPLEVDYTAEEKRVHRALQKYTDLRQRNASGQAERVAAEFVLKLLKKRLFSSPAAFAATLGKHVTTLQSPAKAARRASPKPVLASLRRQIDSVEEDYGDDERYDDATAEAVEVASTAFEKLSDDEGRLLADLRKYAEHGPSRPDSKASYLIAWLHEHIRAKGRWSDERVLIFTEYRDTQKWLQDLLAREGFTEEGRFLTLFGGMPPDDRERIKAAFQAHPTVSPVRILLATDAASEGIDLQNHCHRLIHYEIPWNPNRMEQRNGRLDRHGQRTEVEVCHFVPKGFDQKAAVPSLVPGELEGDMEFLMRAVLKIERIREDLGKVGPVIASQVEEAMLGHRRTLDTTDAERTGEPIRRMLTFERKLQDQIAQFREQLGDSRKELRVEPEHVRAVVETGLELAGQPPIQPTRVKSSLGGCAREIDGWRMPALRGSWAPCAEGLEHPHTQAIRPIVFDHTAAEGRDDVVLAHLGHKLVQMCVRLLREEMWSLEGGQSPHKRLHRATARVVPDSALDTPAVVAHARLVVLGGDNRRLHEEFVAAGGFLRQGRFARMNVGQVEDALRAALSDQPSESVRAKFTKLWPSVRDSLTQALDARMRERTRNLESRIEERATKDAEDLGAVMRELERSIREELNQAAPTQLTIWTEPEQEQFRRNRAALEARLRTIPQEIERETKAIRARYADPTPRLFPVAVTFLVPARLAREVGGST